ncbi:hypothetical protein A5N15_04455 [Rothia kristinae]|uniref:Uncharacterized protein n=1 Tax=Rothia kristinae TaxID=37923 RepID=A0A657IV76_9MICC|nr:hypothetical protein A5N15_04455 [Rothia kristinae]
MSTAIRAAVPRCFLGCAQQAPQVPSIIGSSTVQGRWEMRSGSKTSSICAAVCGRHGPSGVRSGGRGMGSGDHPPHLLRADAGRAQLGQGHGAVAFGQALAVPVQGQRHVGVFHGGQAEQVGEVGLPGRGGQQVVPRTTWSTPWWASSTTTARL